MENRSFKESPRNIDGRVMEVNVNLDVPSTQIQFRGGKAETLTIKGILPIFSGDVLQILERTRTFEDGMVLKSYTIEKYFCGKLMATYEQHFQNI